LEHIKKPEIFESRISSIVSSVLNFKKITNITNLLTGTRCKDTGLEHILDICDRRFYNKIIDFNREKGNYIKEIHFQQYGTLPGENVCHPQCQPTQGTSRQRIIVAPNPKYQPANPMFADSTSNQDSTSTRYETDSELSDFSINDSDYQHPPNTPMDRE
jgi:hypothetical protein